ncbi:MAG: c-type cytochrome [Mucilaginibacter sp.]
MKKPLILFAAVLLFSACGGKKSGESTDSTTTTTTTTSTSTESSAAVKDTVGQALIAKNDCLTCHKIDQKIVGPAYTDVANKYTASDAVIDTLANKVIKGGSGNWGTVAMTPHPSLSLDDAKHMVKYILSLKK